MNRTQLMSNYPTWLILTNANDEATWKQPLAYINLSTLGSLWCIFTSEYYSVLRCRLIFYFNLANISKYITKHHSKYIYLATLLHLQVKNDYLVYYNQSCNILFQNMRNPLLFSFLYFCLQGSISSQSKNIHPTWKLQGSHSA